MSSSTRPPRFLLDAEAHGPARFDFTRSTDNRRALRPVNDPELLLPAETAEATTPVDPSVEAPLGRLEEIASPTEATLEGASAGPSATLPGIPPRAEEPPAPRGLDPRLLAAIEALRLRSERLAEEARADALEIGFIVARKVLEQELRTGPKALFDLIRSAIRKAGESRKITLRLNPEDCATLEGAGEEQRRTLTLAQLELVADPELSPGDCVVEGDLGIVDGRLAGRLAELARAIEQAAREEVA